MGATTMKMIQMILSFPESLLFPITSRNAVITIIAARMTRMNMNMAERFSSKPDFNCI